MANRADHRRHASFGHGKRTASRAAGASQRPWSSWSRDRARLRSPSTRSIVEIGAALADACGAPVRGSPPGRWPTSRSVTDGMPSRRPRGTRQVGQRAASGRRVQLAAGRRRRRAPRWRRWQPARPHRPVHERGQLLGQGLLRGAALRGRVGDRGCSSSSISSRERKLKTRRQLRHVRIGRVEEELVEGVRRGQRRVQPDASASVLPYFVPSALVISGVASAWTDAALHPPDQVDARP